jgi:hypothetical protein
MMTMTPLRAGLRSQMMYTTHREDGVLNVSENKCLFNSPSDQKESWNV